MLERTAAVALGLALGRTAHTALAQELPAPAQAASSPAPRGLEVAPVLKTTTTVLGQPIEYVSTAAPEVTSVVQTYEPGGETGWHYHLTSSHIYVLEGALTLDVADGTTREFGVGEAYMESVRTWHNARNLGAEPLRLLVVTFGESETSNNVFGPAPE